MIKGLRLLNFKCFSDQHLRMAPLTLLSGLNGMGKSSVIQSLLILRQSYLEGALQVGTLATAGRLIDLGSVSDVFFEGAKDDSLEIRLLLPQKMFGERKGDKALNEARFSFSVLKDQSDDLRLFADQAVLQEMIGRVNHSRTPLFNDQKPTTIDRFQYLSAERYGPRKSAPMLRSRSGPMSLGSQGEYTQHILQLLQGTVLIAPEDPRWIQSSGNRLRDQLEAWLGEVSPGVNLTLKPIPEADLIVSGFSFGAAGQLRSRDYRATNVGFGLSYVLPVLVGLLGAPPGSLILIENPEAHLHPRGQTKLGELCARASAAGVQVLVETHSDHLMDGMRIAVRDGILNPEHAAFHYFHRSDGEISVVTPRLNKDGKLSEWPSGFFDQTRRNTARLLRPKQDEE